MIECKNNGVQICFELGYNSINQIDRISILFGKNNLLVVRPITIDYPKNFFVPLIEKAIELISPKRIVLFGSFARGDESAKSDIDLAFEFNADRLKWLEFKNWVLENFKTLRDIDLVDLNIAENKLKEVVRKEGIVLYECKN